MARPKDAVVKQLAHANREAMNAGIDTHEFQMVAYLDDEEFMDLCDLMYHTTPNFNPDHIKVMGIICRHERHEYTDYRNGVKLYDLPDALRISSRRSLPPLMYNPKPRLGPADWMDI